MYFGKLSGYFVCQVWSFKYYCLCVNITHKFHHWEPFFLRNTLIISAPILLLNQRHNFWLSTAVCLPVSGSGQCPTAAHRWWKTLEWAACGIICVSCWICVMDVCFFCSYFRLCWFAVFCVVWRSVVCDVVDRENYFFGEYVSVYYFFLNNFWIVYIWLPQHSFCNSHFILQVPEGHEPISAALFLRWNLYSDFGEPSAQGCFDGYFVTGYSKLNVRVSVGYWQLLGGGHGRWVSKQPNSVCGSFDAGFFNIESLCSWKQNQTTGFYLQIRCLCILVFKSLMSLGDCVWCGFGTTKHAYSCLICTLSSPVYLKWASFINSHFNPPPPRRPTKWKRLWMVFALRGFFCDQLCWNMSCFFSL